MENKKDFENKMMILYKENKEILEKCLRIDKKELAEMYRIKLDTIIEVCIALNIEYSEW